MKNPFKNIFNLFVESVTLVMDFFRFFLDFNNTTNILTSFLQYQKMVQASKDDNYDLLLEKNAKLVGSNLEIRESLTRASISLSDSRAEIKRLQKDLFEAQDTLVKTQSITIEQFSTIQRLQTEISVLKSKAKKVKQGK
jgi:hypothetical protein